MIGPKVVIDGLVLSLDAGNVKSYPGSGNSWLDLSVNENNGTLINGPTFDSGDNGSIVFDGIDDYVSIADSSSLDIIGAISIELFFKTPRESFNERIITKNLTGGTYGKGYQLARYNNDRILFTYNNVDNRIYLYSNEKPSDFFSTYNHIIYTYNGTDSQKIWINGIDETSAASQFTPNFTAGSTSGVDLELMRRGGEEALGYLPLVRIYNRSLTSSEVEQNFNATKTRFGL